MRNCLSFATDTLPHFILQLGIWNVIDAFNSFQIITDVLTLDHSLSETKKPEEMKFAATLNDQGYWTNRSTNFIVYHLTKIISCPGSSEEAVKINTALKTLTIKLYGNSNKFYEIISEGCHRRMLFQKLTQISGPLEDEIKVNSELLIMMINRNLMSLKHLQELSTFTDRMTKITHYIIHNMNHYDRLKTFIYVIKQWCSDKNLIEQLEEIVFDIEMIQSVNIQHKIDIDIKKRLCEMY